MPMDACAIIGFGTVQATLNEIALLRKDPGPGRPLTMEHQVLKHADEHTVLALAAMLKGLTAFSPGTNFEDWGVVAAPRWPGRFATIRALEGLQADGTRGVSPMTIPHNVLHSLSGTVSLVFEMRGPNFGVGGGQACVADGLLAGLVMQLEQQPPGTWVIFSEWNNEPGQVGMTAHPRGSALVLALAPVEQEQTGMCLQLRTTNENIRKEACPRLEGLINFLQGDGRNPGAYAPRLANGTPRPAWTCTLDWGMELVLSEGVSRA